MTSPWRYYKQADGTRFLITARAVGTPGSSGDDFATVDIQHEDKARLAAAAPDLLAALRDAAQTLAHLRSGGYFNRMNDGDARLAKQAEAAARVAIAKAEGKQSSPSLSPLSGRLDLQ